MLHEQHVFQKWLIGKAVDAAKEVAGHEDGLIAIGESEPANALGVAPFKDSIDDMRCVDLLLKGSAAGSAPPTSFAELGDGILPQPVVRVQEQ